MSHADKIVLQFAVAKLKLGVSDLGVKVGLSHATEDEKSKMSKELHECYSICEVLEREVVFRKNTFDSLN